MTRGYDDDWDDPGWFERIAADAAGELAGLSPQDRFEREFGIPATPEAMAGAGFAAGDSSEEVAAAAQDELVQLEHVLRLAEAHRIDALLRAFEASLADLAVRFGPATASGGAEVRPRSSPPSRCARGRTRCTWRIWSTPPRSPATGCRGPGPCSCPARRPGGRSTPR